MVDGQSTSSSPPMSIDKAIVLLDSLISRLTTPSSTASTAFPKHVGHPTIPLTVSPWPPQTAQQEGTSGPNLRSLQLTAEQQEAEKGSILARPGKSQLKLPGAPTEKPAKAPSTAKPSAGKEVDPVEEFEKAHLQVGLVHSVNDHPISEKLFICKVEVSPGQFRQVVAGLRKFIPAGELEQKKVALVLNLKPAKLAGQLSEAMILAGDVHADGVETVKVLEPPQDASPGDRIYLQGRTASTSPAKQLSSKIWEKVVPLLKVEGHPTNDKHVKALVDSAAAIIIRVNLWFFNQKGFIHRDLAMGLKLWQSPTSMEE